MVACIHLLVEGAEVIEPAEPQQTAGEEPKEAGADLADIHAVDAERTEEGLQNPRHRMVVTARAVATVGGAFMPGMRKASMSQPIPSNPKVSSQITTLSGRP